jgi:molybdopterin-containing oxidoreductase family membrane subunit
MKKQNRFLRLFLQIFSGSWLEQIFFFVLLAVVSAGLHSFSLQYVHGLSLTGLSNQITWGLYIGHFLLAEAAATTVVVLYVIAFLFSRRIPVKVLLWAHGLAVFATIGAILFVFADLGRPERFLHMLPPFGILSLDSPMSADVILLNSYIFLNLLFLLPWFLQVCGLKPAFLPEVSGASGYGSGIFYRIISFLICLNGLLIHFAAAFLFSGFGGRPAWNNGFLPLQSITAGFLAGAAFLCLISLLLSWNKPGGYRIVLAPDTVKFMLICLFIFLCLQAGEYFSVFHAQTYDSLPVRLLWGGVGQSGFMHKFSLSCLCLAFLLLLGARNGKSGRQLLIMSAILTLCGVFVKKGTMFVVSGFRPTPLGEIVSYQPSLGEYFVSSGIWALIILLFMLFYRLVSGAGGMGKKGDF